MVINETGPFSIALTPTRQTTISTFISMEWWKKLLVFLGIAALGVLFIKGGCDMYMQSRHYVHEVTSYSPARPGPLLFAISLLLLGVTSFFVALLVIGPGEIFEFEEGFFWVHGLRGIPLILAAIISLLLPPLFLWQLWVLFTENLFKGYPPIAWGRIGGVMSDWVIFALMLIPWLGIAAAGIICPPRLFWKGLKRGK